MPDDLGTLGTPVSFRAAPATAAPCRETDGLRENGQSVPRPGIDFAPFSFYRLSVKRNRNSRVPVS